MSLSDIKHSLRKLEFPQSSKEALLKIDQLLSTRGATSSKQMDMVMDIVAEFIFCETDRRGTRRTSGLNPLQELQLIDIICDYLSGNISEITRNTLFLSLFGGVESQRRLKILSILASMAVSASSTPILLAVGVWLQQMGCSSSQSLQLVENIIRDHFQLNTSNQPALKSLANTAPQFVANFITAVTELYMYDEKGNVKLPPKNLLEVITAWVSSRPSLCACACPAALPAGAIAMAAVSALAGLVRWCARAPLHIDTDEEMQDAPLPPKKIKLEGKPELTPKVSSISESELYIKLHLGVLQSLRAARRPPPPPPAAAAAAAAAAAVLNAQHLAALAPVVHAYTERVLAAGGDPRTDVRLQECLDRIGQAVQVALANGCIYGNIGNLLAMLDNLPENRLLKIIIKTHQQTI